MSNKFISEQLKELESPISTQTNWLKSRKIRLIIINEDYSFKEFFCNYPNSYTFELKNKSYVLVPKAIIRGKYPTLIYFYNNPYPIQFIFQYSKLTAYDLRTEDQKSYLSEHQKTILQNTLLDAETINLAFNTRIMRGLYAENKFTAKNLIIILIVVSVIILIFLQVFGVVDVWGLITGGASAKK